MEPDALRSPRPTPRPLPPVALYIHVPFCVSLCPYCDFVVLTGRAGRGPANRIDAFLAALHVELDLRADDTDAAHGPRAPLRSLYLGGGTPSLLAADAIFWLIEHVRRRYGWLPMPRSPSRPTRAQASAVTWPQPAMPASPA